MSDRFIEYGYIDIYDDKVFTKKRVLNWENYLLNCYEDIYDVLKEKIDYESPIQFNISISLLKEVVVDAVIGMKKIVDSKNNLVENPNSFKIAAYLAYWWLRHKPVSLHYPPNYKLSNVKLYLQSEDNEEQKETARQKLIWQLKHINELVAVQIVSAYIFDFDKEVCNNKICKYVKKKEGANFHFDSFDDMKCAMIEKLTYYFSYRAITPKMIEHFLEAYTFHPAWGLTGAHWSINNEED